MSDSTASTLATRQGDEVGLLAQDVEQVLPRLVKSTPLMKAPGQAAGEFKVVDYMGLIPVLVKGLQEQQELIQQQARLEQLETAMQRMQKETGQKP